MQHVAIDLGSRESQVCIRNPTGDILFERKLPTPKLAGFRAKQPHSRVIVETSAEAFLIADAAAYVPELPHLVAVGRRRHSGRHGNNHEAKTSAVQ